MAFGLPKIPGINTSALSIGAIGALQSAIFDYFAAPLTFGIYEAGEDTLALEVSNVLALTQTGRADAPMYPITEGSFVNYNKINRPDEVRMTITKMGNPNERKQFLDWLQENKSEPNLYDVVTPETAYRNLTLIDYSNVRDVRAGTVTALKVDCSFIEVREIPAQYYKAAEGRADTENAAKPENKPTQQGKFAQAKDYVAKSLKGTFNYTAFTAG